MSGDFKLLSVIMFFAWGLVVALVILGQQSAGQSVVSHIHYVKISVDSSSWIDSRAHTLPG